jgi:carbohydrate binding protein with CBM4/9 domain
MLLSFAQQQGLSEIAFWSVNRDQPCPGGATGGPASGSCSGVTQNQFDFERIFNQFNGGGGGPTPTPTQRPTPTPTPTPSQRPTPTPTPPPGGNGMVNGGFEAGLASWSCSTVDSVVSSPVHSGSHSLSAAANNSDNGQCTQTIAVQANHSYTLSAWVQGNYAFIGVSGGGTGDPSTFSPSSSGFTQLSVPFTTGSGVSSLTVFVHGWFAQGTVFVDDVAVN